MWILENEGDAFNGKKLWLRPGKKYLFGRTQIDGGGQFVISDKTISRQHLIVEVDPVASSECAKVRSRSRVTLTDYKTKIGTLVNGEQIRGTSHMLQTDENIVQLGKHKHLFRFTWLPATFTFSFTTKEQKADPYTTLYQLLGPLDIKVLIEYEPGVTTHLVAKKRNTSKGLQALIDGKYIVHNDTFVKAVVAAATPPAQGPSPLEEDFEANFPDPLQYLPPRGEEPTQRSADAYAPNPSRKNMFEGYTFIFYERRQFETLLAPITDGLGKALLREAITHETTVDDFVRYVKSEAGEKGLGEFEDGSEGKGVVVVRFNPVKGVGTEWFADFGREVALRLDHRLIEQNEFLDAILGTDAKVLRRPLEVESSGSVAPPPTAATAMTSQALRSSEPEPAPTPASIARPEPTSRVRSRRTASRPFKGFDDDFDGPVNLNSIPEAMAVDEAPVVESQSQGLFVSHDPEPNFESEPSQSIVQTQTRASRASRKRPVPPVETEEEFMEQMAPATTKLKRQRLADEAARRRRGESTPPPPPAPKQQVAPVITTSKKAKQETDVLGVARERREKADELAKAEREALERDLEGMDIEAIRNLAIVEEFEIKRAAPPPRAVARADESDRWEDKWNGRKNFKNFRRRGADGENRRGLHRVIVPLEEVKKKDFGIGDDYWLEDDKDSQRKNKKKGKEKETQDTSQSQSGRPRPKSRAAERAAEILASEVEKDLIRADDERVASSPDVEIVEKPTKPVASTRSQRSQPHSVVDKPSTSRNLSPQKKRPAAATLTKPAPPKKARQTLIREEESDDSDDDGLRFKFKKK